jgi:hypothetical protein
MAGAAQGTGNTGQVQGWAGARGHAECGRGRTPAAQTGSGFLSQSGVIDVETALGSPLPPSSAVNVSCSSENNAG